MSKRILFFGCEFQFIYTTLGLAKALENHPLLERLLFQEDTHIIKSVIAEWEKTETIPPNIPKCCRIRNGFV